MLKRIRNYININIIGKNKVLIDEMKYYNRIYGRPVNVSKRAVRMAGLFWKYEILKKNPIEERRKIRKKLSYPESKQAAGFKKRELWKLLEDKDYLVVDCWEVLFYLALTKEQLWVLLETYVMHPGLAEDIKLTGQIPVIYQKQWETILIDFSLKNIEIFSLLDQLKEKNIRFYIRNNCSELPEAVTRLLLKRENLYEWKEEGGQGLYLTSRSENNNACIVYTSVNSRGGSYRPFVRENTLTQLYNQMVNIRLHSSHHPCSLFYEWGYAYGGILACGFSQFLNRLVQEKKLDKLIFVARDGDILHKVYEKFFKQVKSSYLLFSRAASYELIFEDFPEEYIDKNIKARIYRKRHYNSIGQILKECGIGILATRLTAAGIDVSDQLTEKNYPRIREILLCHKNEIQENFQNSCDAAREYFLKEVEGCRRIGIIDLGWHGKSTIYLNYLLKNKYSWKGEVLGIQLGASSDSVTQQYIQKGLIYTYAFENEYWRKMGRVNGEFLTDEDTLCIEALFSSATDTLLRYRRIEKGEIDFLYGERNTNSYGVNEIHKGILDFTEQYVGYLEKYHLLIGSRDAFTPLDTILENRLMKKGILQIYEGTDILIHNHGMLQEQ